ncbi:MAG: hypothetical protein IJE01_02320 [Clostridia bacterium]|nr:hypothetical protein [Clostridia bacterium]
MKCIYCGKKTERFFDVAHQECHEKYLMHSNSLLNICKEYENGNIEHKTAVKSFVELCQEKNYNNISLDRDINDFDDIMRKGEYPIFVTKFLTVIEEKNSCRMKSVGYNESRPFWNVEKNTLSTLANLLISDKNLYLDLIGTKILIPLNKIELVKEDYFNSVYFDVKTSSPYPHRYYLNFKNRREKEESNLYCFLSCLSGK